MRGEYSQAISDASRQVQRDTGMPFQASRRVAILLHQYEVLVNRTVAEGPDDCDPWQAGEFAAMLVVDRLVIDFIPGIAFIAQVVPLVEDLLANVAALQVGPAVAEAVIAAWTPCRAHLQRLATTGLAAECAVAACLDRPARRPLTEPDRNRLHAAVVAINAILPPSCAAVERTSDALLPALLGAPLDSDLEMAFEPWEAIESHLGCLLHCGRRLYVYGERLMERTVDYPRPTPLQRLLFREQREEIPIHLWTSAARHAEWDKT